MQQIVSQEQFADLAFPLGGVDQSAGFGQQRQGTTPEGVNVRAFEPGSDRARGGARQGLAKYLDDQVAAAEIQDLNLVVLPSAEALPTSFDDVPTLDTNFQLEDFSGFTLGDGSVNWIYVGGSGYYTHPSYTRTALPVINSLTPDEGLFEGGETITIQGENMGDEDSTFMFGDEEATIISNDGSTATVTVPALADPGEDTAVDVTVETEANLTSEVTESTVYTYRSWRYIQSALQAFESSTGTRQLAYDSDVRLGSLLIAHIAAGGTGEGREVLVADSQMNSWSRLGDYQYDGSESNGVSIWWTVASAAGPNTLQVAPESELSSRITIAVMEYTGQHGTPADSNTGSDGVSLSTPTTLTAGNTPVTNDDSLAVGCFSQDFDDLTFAAGMGFNLREAHTDASGDTVALYVVDQLNVDTPSIEVTGTIQDDSFDWCGKAGTFRGV